MASSTPTFPHLAGRAEAIEALGWPGRDAEWIALVCLHSGVFVRAHFCQHYRCSPQTAMRFTRRLIDARVARQHPLPDTRTNQKLSHIHGKSCYRPLGIPDARHRRFPTEGVLWRRLLSLDAVIEAADLAWLPTEQDKVRYFTGIGIPPEILPERTYTGRARAGVTTRYFAWKLPIAGDAERATFVYADSGLDTTRQLKRWCKEHEPLWAALRKAGLEVHVHAVARTLAADARNANFLAHHQAAASAESPLTTDEERILAEIEAALFADDRAVLRRWGGWTAASRVAAPLRHRVDALAEGRPTHIDRVRTHVASRVADDVYAA